MSGIADRRQRGAALVECALALPLLLLLVMGVIEIGRMTRTQLALAQAAREGAQAIARALTVERVAARVLNTAEQGGLRRGAVIAIELTSSSNGTNWAAISNDSKALENNAKRGNLVRARVRYRHAHVSSLVFSGGSRDMESVVVARRN
ncbi:MAG: pilus assembly protein [Armatimonadetes bacterium]|nr:pilus assembly protein [Armatimonadota bacterium]